MDTLSPPSKDRLMPRGNSGIRLAIAGLGKMGAAHLNTIRELREGGTEEYYKDDIASQLGRLRVCGVCDPRPEALNIGRGIPGFHSWTALLKEKHPHIAIIATPTASHAELAKQSLEAGVHTLVEKPLALTFQECRELAALSETRGLRLSAGHVERYNPVTVKLKSWFASTGPEIRYYRFERSQPLPVRIPEDILTDKLIHDLDLVRYLFGPVEETAVESCARSGSRIIEATVRLRHRSGTEGTLFVSWKSGKEFSCRRFALFGSGRERIQGDFLNKTLQCNEEPISCGVRGWITPNNNQLKDQLTDFIATCLEPTRNSPTPLLTQAEILEAMSILEEIRMKADHV